MLKLHPIEQGKPLDRCKVCNMPVGILRHRVTVDGKGVDFHITCVEALLVDYARDWEKRDEHAEKQMNDKIERG